MTPGELDAMVEGGNWQGLRDVLSAMSVADQAEAARWYRRTGRAQARRLADRAWTQHSRVVQLFLALTLTVTPAEASHDCRWGQRFLWGDVDLAAAACAEALLRRGAEWAAEFVALAAEAAFRGESQRGVGEVVSVASAAVVAFSLPVPTTETYVRGWASLVESAHIASSSDNGGQWQPLPLLTVADGRVRPAYALGKSLTLGGVLANTPAVAKILEAAVTTPNVLNEWASFSEVGWRVQEAIREAVASGVVDRGPLLDGVFLAFSRDDRANNQRVLAEMLAGLDPTPEEVRARSALILHVLPTVHGGVTRVLLGLALGADLPEDELVELGTVILARPEKAQKTTLLRHLATSPRGAAEALLAMAADSDDATLAAKAQSLLGAVAPGGAGALVSQPTSAAGLPPWSHRVEPFLPESFVPFPATGAGLDQARSDDETWSRITTDSAYLDLVVRFAHRDLHAFRSVVSEAPDPSRYSHVRTPHLVHQWVKTGAVQRSYESTMTSYRSDGAGGFEVAEERSIVSLPPAHLIFTDRLVEETLPRLGTIGTLLSTPSRSDGTLDVAVLADRVRGARDVGYGPYDLVQALLRVGRTAPGDVRLFDGLALGTSASTSKAPWWSLRRREPGIGPDGVEAIRTWVAAGGWTPRVVDFPGGVPRSSPLALPLPDWLRSLDGVAGICSPVGVDADARLPWGADEPGPWLGVCPWDVENLAVLIGTRDDLDSVFHAQRLPLIVGSAGPIRAATHHHLARLLGHPRLDSRLLAAQQTGVLARQGRLDPQLLRERSAALFSQGALSLSRVAQGWAELATASSVSTIWPTWVSVLDLACRAGRKPPGLADLLRATREHAPAVAPVLGVAWVPASVRELAAERSSTKAVTEARALLGAVEAGGSG